MRASCFGLVVLAAGCASRAERSPAASEPTTPWVDTALSDKALSDTALSDTALSDTALSDTALPDASPSAWGANPQPAPFDPTGGVELDQTLDPYPPEVIQRVVRANFGRFRSCYEESLRNSPNLLGRVEVTFLIETDGQVSAVLASGDIVSDAVISCVGTAFEALRFPRPVKRLQVSYPIFFTPHG